MTQHAINLNQSTYSFWNNDQATSQSRKLMILAIPFLFMTGYFMLTGYHDNNQFNNPEIAAKHSGLLLVLYLAAAIATVYGANEPRGDSPASSTEATILSVEHPPQP